MPTIKYTLVYDDQIDWDLTPKALNQMAQEEKEKLPENVKIIGDSNDFYESGESVHNEEEEEEEKE